MVLLGANLTSAVGVCRGLESGFKIGAISNLTLGNIFFKLCKGTYVIVIFRNHNISTIDISSCCSFDGKSPRHARDHAFSIAR